MGVKEKRITIRDVAESAGVSIATVSRVMHGNYYVNPDLTERVKTVIRRLGYVPDSNAQSLKSKRRFVIGYVVSDISNRHFTTVSRAIVDSLGPQGYSIITSSTDSRKDKEQEYLRVLLSHRIDGLIINTSGKNDALIARISESIPVVLLHRRIEAASFRGDFIGSDDHRGGSVMAEHLFVMGHRNIGLASGSTRISTFRERMAGFVSTLAAKGVPLPDDRVVYDDYTQEGGYRAAGALLERHPALTALCVLNNVMAIGAYKRLREKKKCIPADISVVSYGEIENSELLFITPTFISQQPAVIGRKAAELILHRINEPDSPPKEEIIPTIFEKGGSVSLVPALSSRGPA